MKLIRLNQRNLAQIAQRLPCPSYDRQEQKTGIVHVGVGGFHRSHQALYIHRLLEQHNAREWGICGVGLREADRKMYEVLRKQDFLYTLTVQHPNGDMASEVIGSLQDFLLAVDDPEAVVNKMADPDTRIVSLTITEGGYNFNPHTEAFDFDNPDVRHELANPEQPKTIFGFLTAALSKRRQEGRPPFSVLSCDNIQHNGDMARAMLLAFARKQDPQLAEWIEAEVCFPNTMVDRITPVTSQEDIVYLQSALGLQDEWPVICEPFIQWVVEDEFSNGRPPLEKLGVQFVSDVGPYETMKIRLLNAGHSVLGIPGAIHGHKTINACMQDPVFVQFMRRFMDEEATPVLAPLEGIDVAQYKDKLEERFANPNIKDSVSRICSESSAKLPKFLIPTIRENLHTGGSIDYATLMLAAWCYYHDKGIDENNASLEIIDARKAELDLAAKRTAEAPLSFLGLEDIFGSIAGNERFVTTYREMVRLVYAEEDIRKIMMEVTKGGLLA